eukprot:6847141-Alexandrium_andersonii.AAC.1
MELITDFLHEGPGGQGIGHGCQRAALVEDRSGQDLESLATDIPPNVCRRLGVRSVKVRSKVGK